MDYCESPIKRPYWFARPKTANEQYYDYTTFAEKHDLESASRASSAKSRFSATSVGSRGLESTSRASSAQSRLSATSMGSRGLSASASTGSFAQTTKGLRRPVSSTLSKRSSSSSSSFSPTAEPKNLDAWKDLELIVGKDLEELLNRRRAFPLTGSFNSRRVQPDPTLLQSSLAGRDYKQTKLVAPLDDPLVGPPPPPAMADDIKEYFAGSTRPEPERGSPGYKKTYFSVASYRKPVKKFPRKDYRSILGLHSSMMQKFRDSLRLPDGEGVSERVENCLQNGDGQELIRILSPLLTVFDLTMELFVRQIKSECFEKGQLLEQLCIQQRTVANLFTQFVSLQMLTQDIDAHVTDSTKSDEALVKMTGDSRPASALSTLGTSRSTRSTGSSADRMELEQMNEFFNGVQAILKLAMITCSEHLEAVGELDIDKQQVERKKDLFNQILQDSKKNLDEDYRKKTFKVRWNQVLRDVPDTFLPSSKKLDVLNEIMSLYTHFADNWHKSCITETAAKEQLSDLQEVVDSVQARTTEEHRVHDDIIACRDKEIKGANELCEAYAKKLKETEVAKRKLEVENQELKDRLDLLEFSAKQIKQIQKGKRQMWVKPTREVEVQTDAPEVVPEVQVRRRRSKKKGKKSPRQTRSPRFGST